MAGKRQEDLSGLETNIWKILDYVGKSRYNCICKVCGTERIIDRYSLKKSGGPKCTVCTGISSSGRMDLTGKMFGSWLVLRYAGDKKWVCECQCEKHTVREVAGEDLRNGKSTGCGHSTKNTFIDITGETFGEWKVLSYIPAERLWLCECSCTKRGKLTGYQLRSGSSKSCGHNTTGLKDLTGQTFGRWTVLRRSPIQMPNKTMWECKCSCEKGTIRDLDSFTLRNGISKSCGCISNEIREQTCLEKYGVKHNSQYNTTRTPEQLAMIDSKDNIINAIKTKFKGKPKTRDLANLLGLDRASTMLHIHKNHLEDLVDIGNSNVSWFEDELSKIFPGAIRSDRKLLDGKEIDLYYPEKKLGIEFNGNYWHSSLKKPKNYHKEKSILALQNGIQLIHIFEYEWNNPDLLSKILNYIRIKLDDSYGSIIYARDCSVKPINSKISDEFVNKYHFQNSIPTKIHLGCFYKDTLVGVMTFGEPRFNKEYQYELTRMCWMDNVKVIGGSEKLFKHFLNNLNPDSVISYCNLSKFNGASYTKMGFNLIGTSDPSYKWVDIDKNIVLNRYQTMKSNLVEKGLGTLDQTEDEIMMNLGYLKIYDCGNLVFDWVKPQ